MQRSVSAIRSAGGPWSPRGILRHRRHSARALLAAVFIGMVAMLSVVAPRTALAHSGLAAASPGPDAVVGGEISSIQLFYGDVIVTFDGTVTGPDGAEIDASFEMVSEIEARIVFENPLSASGDYLIEHTVLSIDDDVVDDEFRFTFDPASPPPQLVFVEEESGVSWIIWVVAAVGIAVIGVLVWQLLGSLRRARAVSSSASTSASTSASDAQDGGASPRPEAGEHRVDD